MIRNLLKIPRASFAKSPIIPTIPEVEKYWSKFSEGYNQFDLTPQTFYYSLLSMMKPAEATNFLQVACGTGKLLPLAMNLKNPEAKYLAVDLSPDMIKLAHQNISRNFQLYQSRIKYEEWLKNMKLELKVANAQEPIQRANNQKFDRIICNCVLMLTEDPVKMLRNLHQMASDDCLLGVSVWGNKDNNNLMMSIRESILELGLDLPEQRSNFHLYKKLDQVVDESGWQIKMEWEQNAPFPVTEADADRYGSLLFHQVDKLDGQHRDKARKIIMGKVEKILAQKKNLNFSCRLAILQKKKI